MCPPSDVRSARQGVKSGKDGRARETARLISESRYLIEFSHELVQKAENLRKYSRTLASRLTAVRTSPADNGEISLSNTSQEGGFTGAADPPTAFADSNR
jgi:hypothetical protein